MSYRICLILVAIGCLAGPVAQLAAEDIFPPPWDETLPNQTSQTWEASESNFAIGAPILATSAENPYGSPTVTLLGNWDYEEIPGPKEGQGDIPTWHVGAGGGTLTITVPNNPGGDLKQIFWQITSDKSVTPTGNPPTTDPPGTVLPSPHPQIQWPVGTWYTYNGLLQIEPNPESETITFPGLVECTNISEIVIDTVCTTIPEPATSVLLGTCALGVLAGAWRRRTRTK